MLPANRVGTDPFGRLDRERVRRTVRPAGRAAADEGHRILARVRGRDQRPALHLFVPALLRDRIDVVVPMRPQQHALVTQPWDLLGKPHARRAVHSSRSRSNTTMSSTAPSPRRSDPRSRPDLREAVVAGDLLGRRVARGGLEEHPVEAQAAVLDVDERVPDDAVRPPPSSRLVRGPPGVPSSRSRPRAGPSGACPTVASRASVGSGPRATQETPLPRDACSAFRTMNVAGVVARCTDTAETAGSGGCEGRCSLPRSGRRHARPSPGEHRAAPARRGSPANGSSVPGCRPCAGWPPRRRGTRRGGRASAVRSRRT